MLCKSFWYDYVYKHRFHAPIKEFLIFVIVFLMSEKRKEDGEKKLISKCNFSEVVLGIYLWKFTHTQTKISNKARSCSFTREKG